MIIKNVRFNLDEISELMYQLEDELSTYMSLIEDKMADEGCVADAINNYTVARLLEMIETLKDLNEKTLNPLSMVKGGGVNGRIQC